MVRTILVLLMLSITGVSSGSMSFRSPAEAACAAGKQFFMASSRQDVEYMGGILERDGEYIFTVAKGKPRADRVTARIMIPADASLVGFWHTHGSPHYSRRYFSAIDTQLVGTLGVPLYLTDPKGRLYRFRPGDRTMTVHQSRKRGLGSVRGNAEGERLPECSSELSGPV